MDVNALKLKLTVCTSSYSLLNFKFSVFEYLTKTTKIVSLSNLTVYTHTHTHTHTHTQELSLNYLGYWSLSAISTTVHCRLPAQRKDVVNKRSNG